MGGKTSAASKNKWSAKAYDRVNLTLPKGKKDILQAYAAEHGESVNGLINKLLRMELDYTVEEWEQKEQRSDE